MYVPKHFEQSQAAELTRFIGAHPLGALVLHGAGGLDANHLPFEFDEDAGQGRLLAHVARANPLWQQARDGDEALVLFRANDAYISPNWYPSKHEQHRQVPTWNYQAVHVHGRIHIRDDEQFVRALVARLTRTHETRTRQARPWKMTDSSKDYIAQMIAAVVGIEVVVERMVGKWKLSQNKDARDRATAAQALADRGDHDAAAAMREGLAPDA